MSELRMDISHESISRYFNIDESRFTVSNKTRKIEHIWNKLDVQQLEEQNIWENRKAPFEHRMFEFHIQTLTDISVRANDARNYYQALSKDFVDSMYRYIEFRRLDSIHDDEIRAGVFSVERDENRKILEGLHKSKLDIDRGLNYLTNALKAGALSNNSRTVLTNAVEQTNSITGDTPKKAAVAAATAAGVQFDAQVATAVVSAQQLTSQSSELSGRIDGILSKTEYLSKDIEFRRRRRKASRDLAEERYGQHILKNSPINFKQSMDQYRLYYNKLTSVAIDYCRAISRGLYDIYGISIPVPEPAKGNTAIYAIDQILMFEANLKIEMARIRSTIRSTRITYSLRALLRSDLSNSRLTLTVPLNKNSTIPSNAKLRGFSMQSLSSDSAPLSASVTITSDDNTNTKLLMGSITPASYGLPPGPEYADTLWNIPATGTYTFEFADGSNLKRAKDIWLHLYVAW
jgi:hypothetical protein